MYQMNQLRRQHAARRLIRQHRTDGPAGGLPTGAVRRTDQAVDPRRANGPDDPLLTTFEGILLGFEMMLDLRLDQVPWLVWLDELGYDTAGGYERMLATRASAQLEHSVACFLTNHAVDWIERQDVSVRPPQLPAPAPAICRGWALVPRLFARRGHAADCALSTCATRCTRSLTLPEAAAAATRPASAPCKPSTTA